MAEAAAGTAGAGVAAGTAEAAADIAEVAAGTAGAGVAADIAEAAAGVIHPNQALP
ncbi:MAG: hypothetical protein U1F44_03860 [Coriobacteriia bacterium]|nr:hypothetical protein [Coriobacteriia bacterium]